MKPCLSCSSRSMVIGNLLTYRQLFECSSFAITAMNWISGAEWLSRLI